MGSRLTRVDEKAFEVPPAVDELEISVFGPGYGESIVLHVGDGNWILVDSCRDHRSREVVPLKYLHSIGVATERVQLVVATHWHDDHLAGFSEVVEACSNALVALPAGLDRQEFLKVVRTWGRRTSLEPSSSGVDEMARTLDILRARAKAGGSSPLLAKGYTILWRLPDGSAQVDALSPSDAAMLSSLEEVAQLLPSDSLVKRKLTSPSHNHTSVVLHVTAGPHAVLLGSDLQEDGTTYGGGWSLILGHGVQPEIRASAFKVPHHGSVNGYHPGVWESMLDDGSVAILTPFNRGRTRLPTSEGRDLICAQADDSYITSDAKPARKQHKDRLVERTLRQRQRPIGLIEPPWGQVRLRRGLSSTETRWDIAARPPAAKLCAEGNAA